MNLKLAAALAGLTLCAGAAKAADYIVIPLETTINAPADVAWKKVSGYCLIGDWIKTPAGVGVGCKITAGKDNEVGAVRTIAGRIEELMVAKTAWSYTYSQPKSPIDYHGTVEIRPIDKGHSKLLYTLVYDGDALPKHEQADKDADKGRRTTQFTNIVNIIKANAEAK